MDMDKFWWLTLGLLIGWVIHWILTSFFCKAKCTCKCCKNGTCANGNKDECCTGDKHTHTNGNNLHTHTDTNANTTQRTVASTVAAAAATVVPSGLFQVGGKDDLKVIEGIGPKVAEIMNTGGIHHFHELAVTPVAKLTELLQAAGLPMLNPDTWPEQAALIAKGDKAGFERLTEELKGGVRV